MNTYRHNSALFRLRMALVRAFERAEDAYNNNQPFVAGFAAGCIMTALAFWAIWHMWGV